VLICNAVNVHAYLTEDLHAQVYMIATYPFMHPCGCEACVSTLSTEYVPTAVSSNISHPAEMLLQ